MNNNKSKEIHIRNHTCYYFDDVINIYDLDLDNILLDEKSYENILIYDDDACDTSYSAKPFNVLFSIK